MTKSEAAGAAGLKSFDWLDASRDPRALQWVREQNRSALSLKQDPKFNEFYSIALAAQQDTESIPAGPGQGGLLYEGFIYDLFRDNAHPRGLWRRTTVASYQTHVPQWEPAIDFDALSKAQGQGLTPSVPPSCYKHRCIFLLAREDGQSEFREFDLQKLRFVEEGFNSDDVRTVAWKDENTLLVSGNWDVRARGKLGLPKEVKEWHRGQPLSSAKIVFRGPDNSETGIFPVVLTGETGERVMTVVSIPVDDRCTIWIAGIDSNFRTLTLPPLADILGIFRGELLVRIGEDWNIGGETWKAGSLVSMSLSQATKPTPSIHSIVEPRPATFVMGVSVTRNGVLVQTYENVRGRLTLFNYTNNRWKGRAIDLPDNSALTLGMSEPTSDIAFVQTESFLNPPLLFEVDTRHARLNLAKTMKPQFDGSRYVSEQLEAVSADGTKVPYFCVHSKGMQLDGKNPTIVVGYGAWGAPEVPRYDGLVGRLWLDRGGVYVLANVRGGGELGPAWHVQGVQRIHTYQDFIAIGDDLIRRGISSSRYMSARGHSNGGLLVATVINMRPDLFHAAVIEHAVLDIYAHVKGTDTAEYGAWSDPEQRAFMERTSPLPNLHPGADFPVTFIKTATNDDVIPGSSRKYAAKLASVGAPFVYYESEDGGHQYGATITDTAAYEAMVYVYLANLLGRKDETGGPVARH